MTRVLYVFKKSVARLLRRCCRVIRVGPPRTSCGGGGGGRRSAWLGAGWSRPRGSARSSVLLNRPGKHAQFLSERRGSSQVAR